MFTAEGARLLLRLYWLNARPTEPVSTAVHQARLSENTQANRALSLEVFGWSLNKDAFIPSLKLKLAFLHRWWLLCSILTLVITHSHFVQSAMGITRRSGGHVDVSSFEILNG